VHAATNHLAALVLVWHSLSDVIDVIGSKLQWFIYYFGLYTVKFMTLLLSPKRYGYCSGEGNLNQIK